MPTENTTLAAFIDALPKVELHVHLVGSASVLTVLELARRHPDGPVPVDERELRAFYEFRDFPHFAEVYEAVSSLVRTPEDVGTLVFGVARDLAAQNVRYVELTVTPYTHQRAGMPMPAVTGRSTTPSARPATGSASASPTSSTSPASSAPRAPAALSTTRCGTPEALVGFGIGGIEQVRPPHRDAFRDAFAAARAAGLRSLPHAGR